MPNGIELTEGEFDALRALTLRFSVMTLLAAGRSSGTVEMTSDEVHSIFEGPWLALREIVDRVDKDKRPSRVLAAR